MSSRRRNKPKPPVSKNHKQTASKDVQGDSAPQPLGESRTQPTTPSTVAPPPPDDAPVQATKPSTCAVATGTDTGAQVSSLETPSLPSPTLVADRRPQIDQGSDEQRTSSTLGESAASSLDALHSALRSFLIDRRHALGEDALRQQVYKSSFLGCGYVRFAGLRPIESVLRITSNPNDRKNPREKNDAHVDELVKSIGAGKYDWQFPIIVFVDPQLLSESMRDALKDTAPFQPWSEPPLLELNNVTQRERELEEELFFERAEHGPRDTFFSAVELCDKALELAELRKGRPMAELGNGNHRIAAMTARAKSEISELRKKFIALQKLRFVQGDASVDPKLQQLASRLKTLLNQQTWQVLVFRNDAPAELQEELIRNDPPKPTLEASTGEEIWMLTDKIDSKLGRLRSRYPHETRAELMDRVHLELVEEKKSGAVEISDDEDEPGASSSNKKKKSAPRARMLGAADGKEVWHRAPTEPCLLEMMLATRACLQSWTKAITTPQVTSMLRETGAPLAAKFWLSLEVLQQICNTPDGTSLIAVEEFVKSKKINVAGYKKAAELWDELHHIQDPIPLGLAFYDDSLSSLFLHFYTTCFSVEKKYDSEAVDRSWEDADNVRRMRSVFERWGSKVLDDYGNINTVYRRMAAAARLYARLPVWKPTEDYMRRSEPSRMPCFYPRAVLPCPQIISQWTRMSDSIGIGAGIEVLEFLLDRHKLMWTMGSGDASTRCRHNWYLSGRGTYHVLMAFFQAESLGPIGARLSEALQYLDSPSLRRALMYVNKAVAPEHRVKVMRTTYGANKSRGFVIDQSVFHDRPHRLAETGLKTIKEVISKMQKEAEPDIVRHIESGDPAALPELLARHPCLKFISELYWSTAPIIWWGSGWGNSGRQRRRFTAGVTMAWGIVEDMYQLAVTDKLLFHRRAWPLLRVAAVVAGLQSAKPWWHEVYQYEKLAAQRAQVVSQPLLSLDSEYDAASDPEDQALNKVTPITGFGPVPVSKSPRSRPARSPSASPEPPESPGPPRKLLRRVDKGKRKVAPSSDEEEAPPPKAHKAAAPKLKLAVEIPGHGPTGNRNEEVAPDDLPMSHSSPVAPDDLPVSHSSPIAPPSHTTPKVLAPQSSSPPSSPLDPMPAPPSSRRRKSQPARRASTSNQASRTHNPPRRAGDSDNEGPTSSLPSRIDETQRPSPPSVVDTAPSPTAEQLWPPLPTPSVGFSVYGCTHHQILRQAVPPTITVVGKLSVDLVPGFDGQVIAFGTKSAQKSAEWPAFALVAQKFTARCLKHVFEARRVLRLDICTALGTIFLYNSPPSMLIDNLAPQIYMLKMSYVKRIAAAFAQDGMDPDDALAEAAFVAGTDGTLVSDSFEWDTKTGAVKALLHTTLPLALQKTVPREETTIVLGTVEWDEEVMPLLQRTCPYMQHAIAQGPTQGSTLARGAINAATQVSVAPTSISPPRLVLQESDRAFNNPSPDFDPRRVFSKLGVQGDKTAALRACGWNQVTDRDTLTCQANLSCFSTGVWMRKKILKYGHALGEDLAETLLSTMQGVNNELIARWEKHAAQDISSVRHLKGYCESLSKNYSWNTAHGHRRPYPFFSFDDPSEPNNPAPGPIIEDDMEDDMDELPATPRVPPSQQFPAVRNSLRYPAIFFSPPIDSGSPSDFTSSPGVQPLLLRESEQAANQQSGDPGTSAKASEAPRLAPAVVLPPPNIAQTSDSPPQATPGPSPNPNKRANAAKRSRDSGEHEDDGPHKRRGGLRRRPDEFADDDGDSITSDT